MKLALNPDDQDRGLFRRIGERTRSPVRLEVDGTAIDAMAGDTLLVALLTNGIRLRDSEFGDTARAGFCLMGACQDCWVWTADGGRLRACTTPVTEGVRIVTRGTVWPSRP
jgi:predicted molibdopterin-dependent oxidoreductase YjgC